MKFGLCYIPDYHQELSGSWHMTGAKWHDLSGGEAWPNASVPFPPLLVRRTPHLEIFGLDGSPAMFIAACARETSRIRLGCSVSLLPLNNPVRLAEDYAISQTLLSRDALDFGVGRRSRQI